MEHLASKRLSNFVVSTKQNNHKECCSVGFWAGIYKLKWKKYW